MALPKINDVTYELKLPSSDKSVVFRPMTVKEEKILLMAMESDDTATQIRNLRQIITNCIVDTAIDVSKLPMVDVDYIWLKLRAKSSDEVVKIPFECMHHLPEGETRIDPESGEVFLTCGQIVMVGVDLDKIKVTKNPENKPKIMLTDKVGVMMRFPRFETVEKLSKLKAGDNQNIQSMFEVIMDCIDMVFDGETTYERERQSPEEMQDFLESLTATNFGKIMKFFETIPVVRHEVHFACPKCKHEVDLVIEGTKSFLASDSDAKI